MLYVVVIRLFSDDWLLITVILIGHNSIRVGVMRKYRETPLCSFRSFYPLNIGPHFLGPIGTFELGN